MVDCNKKSSRCLFAKVVVRMMEILNYETIKLGNCDGMH